MSHYGRLFNLRAGYSIPVREGQRLQIFLDFFNVTNRTNLNARSGDRRSSTFLIPTSVSEAPRTLQLNFRYPF